VRKNKTWITPEGREEHSLQVDGIYNDEISWLLTLPSSNDHSKPFYMALVLWSI
jgi:hypothetical protein